jgi:hypothetical protein
LSLHHDLSGNSDKALQKHISKTWGY